MSKFDQHLKKRKLKTITIFLFNQILDPPQVFAFLSDASNWLLVAVGSGGFASG